MGDHPFLSQMSLEGSPASVSPVSPSQWATEQPFQVGSISSGSLRPVEKDLAVAGVELSPLFIGLPATLQHLPLCGTTRLKADRSRLFSADWPHLRASRNSIQGCVLAKFSWIRLKRTAAPLSNVCLARLGIVRKKFPREFHSWNVGPENDVCFFTRLGLAKINVHLGITAGCRGVHGGYYRVKMLPHKPPR